jgi:hypothetical protein
VSRPELSPTQALVLGVVMGALDKLGREEGVLTDVDPVTDEQGFTDTVLATDSGSGERLVVRVVPAVVSAAQERHLRRLAALEDGDWMQPKDGRGLPALLALERLGLVEHPESGWGAWRITPAGRRWVDRKIPRPPSV